MAPVEGDGQTERTESAGGAPLIPEDEISRKNRQILLERQGKGVKRTFTTEINTLKSLIQHMKRNFQQTQHHKVRGNWRMPKT